MSRKNLIAASVLGLFVAGCSTTENTPVKSTGQSAATGGTLVNTTQQPGTQIDPTLQQPAGNQQVMPQDPEPGHAAQQPKPQQTAQQPQPQPQPQAQAPAGGGNSLPPPPGAAPQQQVGPRYPYGTKISGRPGFVTSPHASQAGLVDVRDPQSGQAYARGTEVKCPYTSKVFLVP